MNIVVKGNCITITIPPDEGQPAAIQLPDGYSFEKIHIANLTNIQYLIPNLRVYLNNVYTFPPVNSKSPCYVQPLVDDTSKNSVIMFYIEKFGQIPDTHYFDKAFEPILVVGEDGNEYNVIPSDQFK